MQERENTQSSDSKKKSEKGRDERRKTGKVKDMEMKIERGSKMKTRAKKVFEKEKKGQLKIQID